MYRLLVWCAILAFAEPHRRPGKTMMVMMLEPIERALIEQEERFVQFCYESSPAIIGELYGTDNYYVTYDLPEARDSRITVRIKHKFLLTTATRRDNQLVIFQDVKLLPDIANTEAAECTYENRQTLKITMPYKVAIGEATGKTCGVVNKQIIDVPCVQSPGSYYQDPSENGYSAPARRSYGSSYGYQDPSQNGYSVPARRPYGSSYGSQDPSENGYSAPARPSYGSSYGSQDSSENGYSVPVNRSAGFTYRSLDSTANEHDDQANGFVFR